MKMMMSSDNNILLAPGDPFLDNKEESKLSKEEECEYYKQRLYSLKIVLEESQEELRLLKEKYRGMSTIELLLQETRQENIKWSKQVKALETAISILQKRLDKNGLSKSVNIQEAELFVPGASKQTFDNLAKETARLRSLLKQENGLIGKKSADEIEDMKGALEDAESENNELRNKIKDMEVIKLKLVSDYEGAIEKFTKEKQEEKIKFEKELKATEAKLMKDGERWKNEKMSPDLGAVEELKDLLMKTVEKCNLLNEQLPFNVTATSEICAVKENTRRPSVSKDDYDRLELKHQEAVNMNRRWQDFSKDREKQIQALNDRIQDLSDPHHMTAVIDEAVNQKTAQLTMELSHKNAEIAELRKQVAGLSKDLTDMRQFRSQMQQDNSTVEILRQQIQVCTEDFNTERKDREQAVQKARVLQEDVTKLNAESTSLRRQIEQLKRSSEQTRPVNKPPSYESSLSSSTYTTSESSPPPQYSSTQFVQASSSNRYPHQLVPVQESPAQAVDHTVGGMPFMDYSAPTSSSTVTTNTQNNGYRSPVPYPSGISYTSMPRPAVPSISGAPTPPQPSTSAEMRNYPSLPRNPALPNVPVCSAAHLGNAAHSELRNYASTARQNVAGSMTPPLSNTSMPPLTRRGGNVKEELPCPKCSGKFSEDILLSHIEACTQ